MLFILFAKAWSIKHVKDRNFLCKLKNIKLLNRHPNIEIVSFEYIILLKFEKKKFIDKEFYLAMLASYKMFNKHKSKILRYIDH